MSRPKPVIRLVCWNEAEARQKALLLEQIGSFVDVSKVNTGGLIGQFRMAMPEVVVIDLDRLPSHGREVGVVLRRSKSTGHLPLVFAGGVPEKVARIRSEFPDAMFAEWGQIAAAVHAGLRRAPAAGVKPSAHMDRFRGSALAKKLGLKAGLVVSLIGAPEGFVEQVDDVPEDVEFLTRITTQTGLVIWFVRSRRELEEETGFMAAKLPAGVSLWIVYPKKAGSIHVDFNQNDVRHAGLAVDVVDYKICAVDEDWSGMKFARRRAGRAGPPSR